MRQRLVPVVLLFWGAACNGVINDAPGGAAAGAGATNGHTGGHVGPPQVMAPPGPATPGLPVNTDPGLQTPACAKRSLPSQPLRRLSTTQYHNTLRDLFGPTLAPVLVQGSLFPKTLIGRGFEADAEPNLVNTATSIAIEDNAARIATLVLADADRFLRALLPCAAPDFTDAAIDGCINAFISSFGARAFRRPLTPNEIDIAGTLYNGIRTEDGARDGFAALLQFIVQSPQLLYRIERGAGAPDAEGLVKLGDYEAAVRLSYLFTNSMPDEPLFAAAARGELSTPQDIAEQARRLMAGPGFREALSAFHRDLLRIGDVRELNKDAAVFHGFTPEVRRSLAEETERFIGFVLDRGDANVRSLLGSPARPVDATLAGYYGVNVAGVGATTWVTADTPGRRGLLTQASFMATLAEQNRTSPIHRGAFFQQEFLCRTLPSLPANVDTETALQSTAARPTARERLAPLLSNGQCSGCHQWINPLGLALENFDGAGRWREREGGAVIDASGNIELDGRTQAFSNPAELATLIAGSATARDCYSLQWYRAAMGRREFEQDACGIAALRAAAARQDGDLGELLVALTQTDAFLYRNASEVQP